MGSCPGANGFACLDRRAGPPIRLASYRINSAAAAGKSASAWKTANPSSDHPRHGVRLATKTAKPTAIAAQAEPSASRIPLTSGPSKTPLQPAVSAPAAAAASNTTPADIAQSHPTVGVASSNTRTVEAQVMAARTLAERLTIAAAAAVLGGLYLSLRLDTAAGPSIVLALAALFFFVAAPALALRRG